MLEELGHDVSEVDSGKRALAALDEDQSYDLVATDFAMAEMNGGDLAEAVRQSFPTMPILFVTGYAKDDALLRWEGRNTRCLDKPFSSEDLARAVELAVGHLAVSEAVGN